MEQIDMFTVPVTPKFGTPPRKLVRRKDPSTSIDAACKLKSGELERMVYETIRSFGFKGCISDEIRKKHPGLPYSSVTARYKALIENGHIIDTGEKRYGDSGRSQRVLRAARL